MAYDETDNQNLKAITMVLNLQHEMVHSIVLKLSTVHESKADEGRLFQTNVFMNGKIFAHENEEVKLNTMPYLHTNKSGSTC